MSVIKDSKDSTKFLLLFLLYSSLLERSAMWDASDTTMSKIVMFTVLTKILLEESWLRNGS